MKLVELKCKNCGAKLSIPKDSKIVTCDFCKTTFQIDDEIKHIKYDNMMQSGYEFEKGRIRGLAEICPDLSKHFMNIHDNIVDLMIPFQKKMVLLQGYAGALFYKICAACIIP